MRINAKQVGKTFLSAILIIIGVFIYSCDEDEGSGQYTVSGTVTIENKPQEDVTVNIDHLVQYEVKTNQKGEFSIDKVTKGSHQVYIDKNYTDGAFVQSEYSIDVNSDLELTTLILPNPVTLLEIQLDSITNEATLIWNSSKADGFREYKLYSHTTSGLDETTGTLEHVATSINDTSITLELANAKELYFRVFVMNEYALLGGSNIQSITTVNMNFIASGNFESIKTFENDWYIITQNGVITIVDTLSYIGNSSLYFNNVSSM